MTDMPVEGNAPIMSSAEMARECEDLAADVATAVAPGARSEARVDLARIEGPKTQFKFEVTVSTDPDFGTWAWWRYVTGPRSNTAVRRAAHDES